MENVVASMGGHRRQQNSRIAVLITSSQWWDLIAENLAVKTLLIAGDNASVLQALGDLVRSVLEQKNQGSLTILTADSEDKILQTLCREKVDVLIMNHDRFSVGYELIRWLNQGPFKMRKVLIGAFRHVSTQVPNFKADGIDAVLPRPVNKNDIKQILQDFLLPG